MSNSDSKKVTQRSNLKSVEVAVRLQRVKEWVSGRQWTLSRHLVAERGQREKKGASRGSSDGGGIPVFIQWLKSHQLMLSLKSQFPLLYYDKAQSNMAHKAVLDVVPPHHSGWHLSSLLHRRVLVPPQALCTCWIPWLENFFTLSAWLTFTLQIST